MLDRQALPQTRAALIASLWPAPTRQCIAAPVYALLPAPAQFGALLRAGWAPAGGGARALQQRLAAHFPAAAHEKTAPQAQAA